MDLVLEKPGNIIVVNAYVPGKLRAAGKDHTQPLVLSAGLIIEQWAFDPLRLESAELDVFEPLLSLNPELIVLGTGDATRHLPPKLVFGLYQRGVGVECMDTAAACRTYNITVSDGRRVVAGLVP